VSKVIKFLAHAIYRPMLSKYLGKTRWYRYKGIRLRVSPAVFHPGFFSSTQLLLKSIQRLSLAKKKFLELGAGSGLISVYAAKQDALVSASDISTDAVGNLSYNFSTNNIKGTIFKSDLFKEIPRQVFDIIAINPPYYKKAPVTNQDYAWYCGENGEYFSGLFKDLKKFTDGNSIVLMVLCDGCDIEMINNISLLHGYILNCIYTRTNLLEKNFIYQIQPA
jgi:release factor glutamine methyltransferase